MDFGLQLYFGLFLDPLGFLLVLLNGDLKAQVFLHQVMNCKFAGFKVFYQIFRFGTPQHFVFRSNFSVKYESFGLGGNLELQTKGRNWSVRAGFDVDPDRWISNSIRVVEGRRKGFGSSLSNAWGIIKKSFWERVYTWLWRVPIWALSSASSSSNFFSANLEDSSRDTFSARRFSISAIISFELCTILRRRRSSNVLDEKKLNFETF